MTFARQLIHGLGWVGAVRFFARAVVFIKILYIYRLLDPHDVGLFGLCAIVLGLLEMLTETGINIIIVNDKRPLTHFLDTAFVVSLIRGLCIALLVLALSFVLPAFFQEPDLRTLLLIAAVIPLVRGAINPAIVRYQKELAFRQDAMIRLLPTFLDVIFSTIAVTFIPSAFGLLIAMLSAAVTEFLFTQLYISPRPKLRFHRDIFREIVNPGKWLNLTGVASYVEQNIDNFLVGKFLGTTALGYYQSAFNLTRSLIAEVGTTYAQVTLPVYGTIAHDTLRFRKMLMILIGSAGVIMLLPTILLNLPIVQEFLLLLLKEKWRPVFDLIPFLSLAAWITGMNLVFNPIMLVKQKYKTVSALYVMTAILLSILLLLGISQFGLQGAALAVLTTRILMQPFFIWRTIHAVSKQ